jgi:predicted small secreted protein
MFKKILVSVMLMVTMLTQVVNATVTILPIPTQTNVAGEFGQVQGMITAVSSRYVIINTTTVTFDGDTTISYNGGLSTLSVGEMVNYSYTVDIDGVILATVMDVYPAETITSTDRVSRIDVDNSTAIVALTLYRGPIVDFYQASGIYVQGAGTQTSYGCQLVNWIYQSYYRTYYFFWMGIYE